MIEKLEKRLKWLDCVHPDIREQYSRNIVVAAAEVDVSSCLHLFSRLKVIPLSHLGMVVAMDSGNKVIITLTLCNSCQSSLNQRSKGPPKFAIANNWATGKLPDGLCGEEGLTYAEIRMGTRAPISSVIKVIGRNDKELKHHTMALLATPKPALLQVSLMIRSSKVVVIV
jgi:hypothetical protein